jgi:hypothetical protein
MLPGNFRSSGRGSLPDGLVVRETLLEGYAYDSITGDVGTFNPDLNFDEEPELSLRIPDAGIEYFCSIIRSRGTTRWRKRLPSIWPADGEFRLGVGNAGVGRTRFQVCTGLPRRHWLVV